MGYRADKEKVENTLKIIKRVSLGILLICIVGLCIFSAFVPPNTWKYYVAKPRVGKRKAGEMRLHFIDVGQGDCSLIELPDGRIMMIDGGDKLPSTEKSILRYLNALRIETIDYLLITHADEDHCGALDTVLKYKNVLNAYLPPTYPAENTEYAEVYKALEEEDCRAFYSSRAVVPIEGEYDGKAYSLSFLYPYRWDIDYGLENGLWADDNDYSAVLYADYQGVGALFTSDIDFAIEEQLQYDDEKLDAFENFGFDLSSTEILKIAHHGSKYSTGKSWLEYLNVKTAVISCGAGNPYGHPAKETLMRLTAVGADIWRTDTDGHIVITISPSGTYSVKKV